MSDNGAQLRSMGVDFTEGGNRRTRRKTLEGQEKQTTQQLYSYEFQVLGINTTLYPGGHPSSYSHRPTGLNFGFSGQT